MLPAVVAAAGISLGLAGCSGSGTGSDAEGRPVSVVATTTVLGDVAGLVATCGGGEVQTLMPIGADPHDFAPSSAEVTETVQADLVVANGLGLEEGLESALATARDDGARVLEVGPLLDPLPFGDADDHDSADETTDTHDETTDTHDETTDTHDETTEGADHEHGSLDPHVWLDASRMASAATLIGAELAEVSGDDAYVDCGAEVAESLMATDEEVRSILEAVPADSRILVTDHDAFGYFADAYDFEIAGVVIPGGSTLAQPSSAELSSLVQTIQSAGVPAVFANTANPSALVDAVAEESGAEIEVVELFVGSLGPDGSGAETYAGMMTTDAERIAEALAG